MRVLYQLAATRPAAAVVLVALVGIAWVAHALLAGLPDAAELRTVGHTAQATILYDRDSQPVSTLFREQRIDVPLDRISPHLTQAIVAVEDRRFFDHEGIDVWRIVGAAWYNVRQGRLAQGASTITQQLARQRFLTLDKTLRRKIREAILAKRLERLYSKPEILELYLNEVYFGDGLHGAEAAARGYFGKPAEGLDLAEAALLAGLVRAPSTYSPTVDLDRAIERRNLVLRVMRELGAIDEDQEQAARQAEVVLRDALGRRQPTGEYFVEEVRRALVEQFGFERVYESGLHVYTTIDAEMQREAERAVTRALSDIEASQTFRGAASGRPTAGPDGDAVGPDSLQAALVAVDPHSGEVRALVGGREFVSSEFNRAVQAQRQPGSAFKPFVYAAAIEAGYSPASRLDQLNEPIPTAQGPWLPEDAHVTDASLTLRSALTRSSNRAAVRMLHTIGIPQAVSYVDRLGLGPVPPVPSMALGSGEVSLLSMTLAYGVFANHGILHTPVFIRRVVDADGTVLFEAEPSSGDPVISDTTAFLMADILADVVDLGTASRVRRLGFTRPAGGKTGTTNDFADTWFVGFTPDLVTGVWVGFDQPRTIAGNGYASDLAVPLWTGFMKAATRTDSPSWFTPPPGIVVAAVCELSGRQATDGCRQAQVVTEDGNLVRQDVVRLEYFVEGTVPHERCDLHSRGSFRASLARAFDIGTPKPFKGNSPEAADTRQVDPASAEPPPNAPHASADKTKEKRGFWGRIFGFGR